MKNINLITSSWPDYELIDSGGGRKLERFGRQVLIRPEPQALWEPRNAAAWKKADAEFAWSEGKGSWKRKKELGAWELSWNAVRAKLQCTPFKHVGLFPEQAPNWEWIQAASSKLRAANGRPKVLNLFGYTGMASIVAALAGAEVLHVDASKQANAWAAENALRSGVPETATRFITEDALKFAEREARRGKTYGGILLDPPAFGRGPKGEVWKIEEDLPRLLAALRKLLAPLPGAFFLLNGYAAGYSPRSLSQAAEGVFGPAPRGEFGELQVAESGSGRVVPSGIYVRFTR